MLLDDSFVLLQCAEDPDELQCIGTFIRSSILASMLIPEIAANICIETLDLEKSVFNGIDRLSVIAKFDIFLRMKFRNRKIDKGIFAVQGFQEIKRLRDRYVHSKRLPIEWKLTNYEETTETSEYVACPSEMSLTKIGMHPANWTISDAKRVMIVVHSFMSYFFRDCCKYSSKRTTSLLFSVMDVPNPDEEFIPCYDRSLKQLLKDWGVDMSYLKLCWN